MGRCVALLLFVMVAGSVSAQSLDCVALANGARLAGPGAVVLLGEIHGTVEAPTVVASLVCQALTAGRSVTVGLEIPIAEAAAIQSFLTSPDSTVARERLLAGAFWQRDYQDGRSSAAMIHLLETLARYRAATDALRVVLIDDPSFAGGRDAHMAQAVADAIVARPDDVLVTLTGNLHNRLTRGTRYAPMGYRLRRLLPWDEPDIEALLLPGGRLDTLQKRLTEIDRLASAEAKATGEPIRRFLGSETEGEWRRKLYRVRHRVVHEGDRNISFDVAETGDARLVPA